MKGQDPKGNIFDAKMDPKKYPKQWKCTQEGNKKEAKTSGGTFQDTLVEQGRSGIEKRYQSGVCGAVFRSHFGTKINTHLRKNILQNLHKSVTEKAQK